ncbi:MAG: hypothetical protein HFH60_03620 [Lachnospiraceae bacterium]|nr:hypothetical protein [Lachnospiraceae bacterium]
MKNEKSITMKEAINIILEHYKGDVTKISRMKDENKVLVTFRWGSRKEVSYKDLCQMYLTNQMTKSLQDFFIDDNFTGTVSSIDVEGKRIKYSFYLKRNNIPVFTPTSIPLPAFQLMKSNKGSDCYSSFKRFHIIKM